MDEHLFFFSPCEPSSRAGHPGVLISVPGFSSPTKPSLGIILSNGVVPFLQKRTQRVGRIVVGVFRLFSSTALLVLVLNLFLVFSFGFHLYLFHCFLSAPVAASFPPVPFLAGKAFTPQPNPHPFRTARLHYSRLIIVHLARIMDSSFLESVLFQELRLKSFSAPFGIVSFSSQDQDQAIVGLFPILIILCFANLLPLKTPAFS